MPKKTVDSYADDIQHIHTELNKLPEYHPEYEKLEKKLSSQLGKWANLADIVVFAASNEQDPYTELELGLPVQPMALKSKSGYRQVADYLFQVNGIWSTLAVERKGVTRNNGNMKSCDLYSTLFNNSNRNRFKNEYIRFQADLRLKSFKVLVECSYEDFLSYTPLFNGNKRNSNHNGASINSRIGTITSLEEDGCHIIWTGNRERAIEMYRSMIRMWIIKNYASILDLKT